MIQEKDYLEAKKIVEAYEEQLKQALVISSKQKELEQKKREDECGEHYYISSGGKWSSQGQMICCHCGHTIGR